MTVEQPHKESARRLAARTPQHVADMINHVARASIGCSVVDVPTVQVALTRYERWACSPPSGWPNIEYCEFAAFFALELTQGKLCAGLGDGLRLRLALDFIVHIVLEHGLRERVWRVEDDLQAALCILLTSSSLPEQLLSTFRVRPLGCDAESAAAGTGETVEPEEDGMSHE
jgi:hypothetical protein